MKTIWKLPFDLSSNFTLSAPGPATVISVQVQDGQLCAWVEVNTDRPTQPIKLDVYGTGHELPELPGVFIDTVQAGGWSSTFTSETGDPPTKKPRPNPNRLGHRAVPGLQQGPSQPAFFPA